MVVILEVITCADIYGPMSGIYFGPDFVNSDFYVVSRMLEDKRTILRGRFSSL